MNILDSEKQSKHFGRQSWMVVTYLGVQIAGVGLGRDLHAGGLLVFQGINTRLYVSELFKSVM